MSVSSRRHILLALTEQEADIVQNALGKWTGPYVADQTASLTEEEVQRSNGLIEVAGHLCEQIQEELLALYHEHETYWGTALAAIYDLGAKP